MVTVTRFPNPTEPENVVSIDSMANEVYRLYSDLKKEMDGLPVR